MEYNKFKEVLDAIRANDEFFDKLDKIGIYITSSDLTTNIDRISTNLFTEIYGEEGNKWIDWYLYDWPHYAKLIEKNGPNKDYYAWDEDGNPMDLSTDDKLWDMLEKDYKVGGKYHNL